MTALAAGFALRVVRAVDLFAFLAVLLTGIFLAARRVDLLAVFALRVVLLAFREVLLALLAVRREALLLVLVLALALRLAMEASPLE